MRRTIRNGKGVAFYSVGVFDIKAQSVHISAIQGLRAYKKRRLKLYLQDRRGCYDSIGFLDIIEGTVST